MRRPIDMAALVAMAVTSTSAAHADAPVAGQDPSTKGAQQTDKSIDVVVTGTRTREDSRRAPVRTDVITRAEAERRGATNVGEALSGQLGVQVNPGANSSVGYLSGIQIQGFDAERVLVLEDGERIIGDKDGVIDLASIPLSDVSRIELVTGPSSSLYGTSAIGGVVNVLSAPPEIEGFSGRASAEGRYPLAFTLRGSGAYRQQDSWASVDTSLQRKSGIALDPTKPALTLPNASRLLLGLRAGTKISDRITLMLRGRWIHEDFQGLVTESPPGSKKTYFIDLPERKDRFALQFVENIELPRGAMLRISGSRQWFLNNSVRDRRNSPLDESRDRSDEMQSYEAIATIPEGSSRTYVVGARLETERVEQDLTKTSPTSLTTTNITELAPTSLGSAALYGQIRWAIGDKLTLLPGLRGETNLHYGGVLAPRLAASFAPLPSLLFRLSGGRGFRAPGAKELGFSFDHSSLGYCVLGNDSGLKPENSWGVNGDVSLTPQRGLTLRAGAFANWIDDLIDFKRLGPEERDDIPEALLARSECKNMAVDIFQYKNVAHARTSGAQLDASFRVNPWLRFEAGYAYLWTRDDTSEQPLPQRPPHTGTLAITATLPFQLEAYLRWRGVTDTFVDEENRAPGFHMLDVRFARELWTKAKAYVGMQNILGVQKDILVPGDLRPIEGRTIYFGLSAEAPWRDE